MFSSLVDNYFSRSRQRTTAVVIMGVLLLTIITGLLAAKAPLLVIAAVVFVMLFLANLVWTEAATLIVVFILYTNTAAIAVKYHNVPLIIAAPFSFLLILPLTYYLVIKREPLILDKSFWWILGFLLVHLLGIFVAIRPADAIDTVVTFLIEGIGFYVMLVNAIRTPETLRKVVWVLVAAGILMGGIPLYQQITQTFDNNYWGYAQNPGLGIRTGEETLFGDVRQPRHAGALGEKNYFSQVMMMLVPIGIVQFVNERSRVLKGLGLLATILSLIAIILTYSRGAGVGFAMMMLIAFVIGVIKPRQFLAIVIASVIFLAAFPNYAERLASISEVQTLLSGETQTLGDEPGTAISRRYTEMLAAIYAYADHPIIGVGPGMYRYHSQSYGNQIGVEWIEGTRRAHSLYLETAANHGTLGLIMFFGAISIVLKQLYDVRNRYREAYPELSNIATGVFLAIVAYLTTGLFLSFAYIRYFWFIIALGSATASIAQRLSASSLPDESYALLQQAE